MRDSVPVELGGSAKATIRKSLWILKSFLSAIASSVQFKLSLILSKRSWRRVRDPSNSWASLSWIRLFCPKYHINAEFQTVWENMKNVKQSYLWMVNSVPLFIRWRPSNTAIFPSIAAFRSGEGLQTVSPFGNVVLCWRRSLAVISYHHINKIHSFKYWIDSYRWMNAFRSKFKCEIPGKAW